MNNPQEITHEDMKRVVADGQAWLVDCNGSGKYTQMHIPGAIDFEAEKDRLKDVLPLDKYTPIVVYCGSKDCHAYEPCAQVIMNMGYPNVSYYALGISGWKEHGEKTEAAEAMSRRN